MIIYYSRKGENYFNGTIKKLDKGNTEIVAEFIQKAVGGDLFEVETVKKYSEDYYKSTEEAKIEIKEKARPELKKYLTDISKYNNIFICGPCWWGTFPMAIFSQIEKLDWTGKKVIGLMTHEGSGLGASERDLKKSMLVLLLESVLLYMEEMLLIQKMKFLLGLKSKLNRDLQQITRKNLNFIEAVKKAFFYIIFVN